VKVVVPASLREQIIRQNHDPVFAGHQGEKSLDGKPKFRVCVDFEALNSVTKFESYPLPVIEETTSTLYGSKYYSVIGCYQSFWQINIREDQRERTGFTVPSGLYEFNKYPFGLSNSPSSFKRLMDIVLKI